MPGSPAQDPNAAADQEFRRLDTKGSGRLSSNEMPEALKAERDKWDTNKDGFIDINEFRAYYKARMPLLPKPGGPSAQKPDGSVPQEEESRRLIVYRNGKSPEGIDDLFIKCDTDKDGQISLAEWRKAGQSVNQFLAMDRNGDGFVTAEEYLRSKGLDPNTPSTALAAGGSLNGEGYPMQGFYQNGVPAPARDVGATRVAWALTPPTVVVQAAARDVGATGVVAVWALTPPMVVVQAAAQDVGATGVAALAVWVAVLIPPTVVAARDVAATGAAVVALIPPTVVGRLAARDAALAVWVAVQAAALTPPTVVVQAAAWDVGAIGVAAVAARVPTGLVERRSHLLNKTNNIHGIEQEELDQRQLVGTQSVLPTPIVQPSLRDWGSFFSDSLLAQVRLGLRPSGSCYPDYWFRARTSSLAISRSRRRAASTSISPEPGSRFELVTS